MPLPSEPVRGLIRRALVAAGGLIGMGLAAVAFFTSLQTSLATGW